MPAYRDALNKGAPAINEALLTQSYTEYLHSSMLEDHNAAYNEPFESESSVLSLSSEEQNDANVTPDSSIIPRQSIRSLFLEFLLLGMHAWGGPMAQIALLKQRFTVDKRWLSSKQFNRMQGVYQLIPGPEATELCIALGILSNGRFGGLIAGIGFVLPGALLMLGLSFLYIHYGISNAYFAASFKAIQPAVAAMMFMAVYRIGKGALVDQDTHKLDIHLLLIAASAALQYILHINTLITVAVSAIWYFLRKRRYFKLLMLFGVACIGAYAAVIVTIGFPSDASVGFGIVREVTLQGLLVLGICGGLFSVGGAFSAVPFMEAEAVIIGKWITKAQFLDSLALSASIPAPMVIFSEFIGLVGGEKISQTNDALPVWAWELLGAILCAIGMFLPAFTLTIALHSVLDRLVHNPKVASVWDGITACVVGLVAVTAVRFVKIAVATDPLAGLIFVGALAALCCLQHPSLSLFIIIASALTGQLLYSPQEF